MKYRPLQRPEVIASYRTASAGVHRYSKRLLLNELMCEITALLNLIEKVIPPKNNTSRFNTTNTIRPTSPMPASKLYDMVHHDWQNLETVLKRFEARTNF